MPSSALVVQIEMPLTSLYAGETLFPELLEMLRARGFEDGKSPIDRRPFHVRALADLPIGAPDLGRKLVLGASAPQRVERGNDDEAACWLRPAVTSGGASCREQQGA